VLVAAVVALVRLEKRLPLQAFFLGSGFLLCLLAAVLGGKGIHALQAVGMIPSVSLELPTLEWLGFYPDLVGLLVQALIVAALLGAAFVTLLRLRRNSRSEEGIRLSS
jgi:high-affinity iron transporter